MARVFLSHASADKPAVRRIAAALRAAGHKPWFDDEQVLVGESIPAAIERGLRQSDFVVICLSEAAAVRGWIEAERDATLMQQFRERKDRILPVRLEDVTPPHLIAPIAYVDLFPDQRAFTQGIARLMSSIEAHEARRDDADRATRTRTPAITKPTAVSRPTVRRVALPTPSYANAEAQALSEQLESARLRKQSLRDAGIATQDVDREILHLRRQLREGGQLRAGDALGDGRYLLIKRVGRGGFAVVWEAFDRTEQWRVAIKVLHQHLAGDPQRRERFFRGARAMMELEHPAVVRVFDPRGEDDAFCYFVMELMPGGNLRDAVLGQSVEPGRSLQLILQVGEALAAAHGRGLVHRDIKPANILLDERGNAKLADFDLVSAHDTTGGTRTGALGTVVYAAPECLDKPQDATARADVYGLGMTAIFCLLGEELTLSTFRNPEPTIARLSCSSNTREVLARAVAWDADSRFEDAGTMLVALRGAPDTRAATTSNGERTEDREGGANRSQPEVCNGIRGDKLIAAFRFIAGKYQGGEFPLRMNREFIVGRSSDVDIVLVDDIVSRRHAKISSTEAEVFIEDIGSTNGTFVNGGKLAKVAGRVRLQEGDRLLVGTSIIKLVAVEGQLANQSEAEARRRLEAGAQQRQVTIGRPMSGVLEEIPMLDLLQLLSTSQKSGVLTVNNGVSTGKIYLRKGALYFATINDNPAVSPQKSIHRMLTWLTGVFELEPSVELNVREEIQESTEALLMEGVRQLDEFRNLQRQLPPLGSPLAVPTPLGGKLRELSPSELDTFQLVLDRGQLQKVLDNFPGTALDAAQSVIHLMEREFVVEPQQFKPSADSGRRVEMPDSTGALVIERLRQLDEFRDLQTYLPPLGSPLAVPVPIAGRLRSLTPSELDTFQLVLDHGEVRKALGSCPKSALDMARNIISLMQSEFIVVP